MRNFKLFQGTDLDQLDDEMKSYIDGHDFSTIDISFTTCVIMRPSPINKMMIEQKVHYTFMVKTA